MKGMNLMGKRTHGKLARLGATAMAMAAITTAGYASGVASAAVAKPAALAAPAAKTGAASVTALTAPAGYTPPKRTLREGMTGADVKALQRRLAALKYYPGTIDGAFGSGTLEAVWAFQEVNGIPATGVIGTATKRALVHPHTYKAWYPKAAGTRVEVNLGMGVLLFYRNHTIALISHISSAGHYWYPCGSGSCYAITPTGEFHALYFISGWHKAPLGLLYNPVYFNYSGYAIHGENNAEVPVNPVSHGCIRIPFDIATWFYKNLTISEASGKGTQIWIYNQW
jgi:peptidoglycan hydrolase-like protein with peptidoglycan-binding domain